MKQKAKWGLLERLLAAALVLSLAAAGVFLWLFSREAREYTQASDDYDKIREQYLGTVVPDTLPPEMPVTPTPEGSGAPAATATAATVEPTPSPTLALEQEGDEEAPELVVILLNEAEAVSRSGATTTPMPTPAPTGTPAASGADAGGDGAGDGAGAARDGADGAGGSAVGSAGSDDGAGAARDGTDGAAVGSAGSDDGAGADGAADGAGAARDGTDGAAVGSAGSDDGAGADGAADGAGAARDGADGSAVGSAGSDDGAGVSTSGTDGSAVGSTAPADGAGVSTSGTDGSAVGSAGSDDGAGAARDGTDGSAVGSAGSTDGSAASTSGTDGSAVGSAGSADGSAASTSGTDGSAVGSAGSTDGSAASTSGTDGSAVGSAAPASTSAASTSAASTSAPATPEPPLVGRSVTEKVRYSVDFAGLQQTNADVCAWLLQEDTAISYPVVQGRNNQFYLEHLYTGLKSQAGSIFADCGNSRYFTDMITYLYGHNRKDGAMFSAIPEYMNQAYADAHPSFYLLTPYMDYRLDVFACIRVSVDDKEDWHIKGFTGRREFDSFLRRVRRQSAIRTSADPQWGDQLLALCTCTNEVQEERYVVFTRMSPIQYETDESVSLIRRELDTADTLTHKINVPGVGEMLYYATNDPLWAGMCYEWQGGTGRSMGSGGSGPCAMAMITAQMLDPQYLWWLNYYSGREQGHTFCTCSVNQYFCNRKHAQYRLQTPEEFLRYLPVAMASFASGNNQWHENSRRFGMGTGATFMKRACDIFGLYFEANQERDAVFEMLGRGGMVVAVCGYGFAGGRHYVVIASMDDTYLYILDPYYVEEYPENTLEELEMLEPGLLRAKIKDWEKLRFGSCYLMKQWPY